MARIIYSEKWVPSDGIVLEENAKLAIETPNNILVVAGPGAGKTELLAQKASYLLQTNICNDPRKILAISFKKDAAENLRQRVKKRCGDESGNRFASMTYDAFSKSLLDHFRYALPNELRPNPDYIIGDDGIIDNAFRKVGYNNPLNFYQSRLKAYYDKVISTTDIPFKKDDLGEKAWALLLKGFDNNPACLTFKMISILAEYIVNTNTRIRRALLCTYSHIFLDEFQDTTSLQYYLVKTCFGNSDSIITAVGDNKQRIMLWAGAREIIFDDFQREFSAQKTQLIMNHRSAPRLVELQQLMYASLQEDDNKILTSEKWNPNDGEIKLFISDNEISEATAIAENIANKISEGLKPNDICILCKQTPQMYTEKIIEKLKEFGIKARIETEYQDLIKEPIILLITNFMRLSIERKSPDEWEAINESLQSICGISDIDAPNVYDKKQEELFSRLDACNNNIISNITSKGELENLVNDIILFWGMPELRNAYPAYIQGDYFNIVMKRFVELLWKEHEQCPDNWTDSLANFIGTNSIPIMTIHKSKGLEYEAVYFVGLEDGAFWNFKQQPMEDRCAFFVAVSRAKQYINVTYCNVRESLKYPRQYHKDINEFFELLTTPGIAEVIRI
jgi:superfamily I DNA/RNA helicase